MKETDDQVWFYCKICQHTQSTGQTPEGEVPEHCNTKMKLTFDDSIPTATKEEILGNYKIGGDTVN